MMLAAWMAWGSGGGAGSARLGAPEWLPSLLVVPVVVAALALAALARGRAAARLARAEMHASIGMRVGGPLRRLRGIAIALSLGLIGVALARPQWDPRPVEVTRRGRDIVFLVDVSRSMLARDLAPNRLERAKLWIRDLSDSIRGDRVALVAFAGAAVVKCPLTLDHGFFRLCLDELSPDSVPRGGTNIGDAIRKVLAEVIANDPEAHANLADIILITDGEDHESLPIDAARDAAERGVRIIVIGVGSDIQGAIIPVEEAGREQTLTHAGQLVRTRQDSSLLARIAAASASGVYLNVGTGTIDLDRVYADLVRTADQTTTSHTTAMRYKEGFQALLLAALVLLVMEGFLRERSI